MKQSVDADLARQAKQIEDSVTVDLPPEPPQHQRVTVDIRAITVIKVLAILFGVLVLTRIWEVITWLAVATMLAAALAPYLAWLERRGMPRGLALTIVFVSLVAIVLGLVALIVPGLVAQTRSLAHESGTYATEIQNMLAQHNIHVPIKSSLKNLPQLITTQSGTLVGLAVSLFYSAVAMVTIVIVTMYLLIDQERIKTFFVGMFPQDRRAGVLRVLSEMRRQVGGYVRGQIISSFLAATFAGVILFALGIPHYLTLAAFVFLADFVPMFGQTIGTIPPVLIALTISPVKALIVLVLFVLYQQLENHVIVPKVYANTLELSPLVALMALLLGAKLLGIVGMLLSLPLVAALPVILDFAGIHIHAAAGELRAEPDAAKDLDGH